MTRRALCASGAGLAVAAVAVPAVGQTVQHAYGPHARQTLRLLSGRGNGPHPLVVMVGDEGFAGVDHARALVARGMSVALIDRRGTRHGFAVHTGDVARAIGYLMTRTSELGLDGRLALWGEERGAEAVLLTLRDRRYLSVVGMTPGDVWGAVLLARTGASDATFTRSEAYGTGQPAGVFDTKKAADGAAFLSGLF